MNHDMTDQERMMEEAETRSMRAGSILYHSAVLHAFEAEDQEGAWCEDILFSLWWDLTRHVRTKKGFTQEDMHRIVDHIMKPEGDTDAAIEARRDGRVVSIAQFKAPKKANQKPN
jgi:hypothetical protein